MAWPRPGGHDSLVNTGHVPEITASGTLGAFRAGSKAPSMQCGAADTLHALTLSGERKARHS